MKLLGVTGAAIAMSLLLVGCSSVADSTSDAVVQPSSPAASTAAASSADVTATSLGISACPNGSQAQFEAAITALVRVNSGQTNAAIVHNNVDLFLANVEELCGTSFTNTQRQHLSQELVRLTAG